jgi:hypothetical protein
MTAVVRLSRPDRLGCRWTADRTVEVRPLYAPTPRGGDPRIDGWLVTDHGHPDRPSRRERSLAGARELAADILTRRSPAERGSKS